MYEAARPDCPYQDLNENNKNKKKKKSTTGKSEGFSARAYSRSHVAV